MQEDGGMNPAPGRRLFFVINQSPLDGSAHALYCLRNCWWLAQTRPEIAVHLLFPGSADWPALTQHSGLSPLANLHLVGLPALRRARGGSGLTINLVFYLAATAYLSRWLRAGDWLVSASFAKLFHFLLARRWLRRRCRAVYEVHQLTVLDDGHLSRRARREFAALAHADLLLATTGPLRRELETHLPDQPVATLGLACGFVPEEQPPLRVRRAGEAFVLGYIGSLYAGQGVDWLVEHWPQIAAAQPEPVTLEIIGGSAVEVEKMRASVTLRQILGVTFHGAVPAAQLRPFLATLDALVIPSLPVGRMPCVAITKAYDYPGLNRPVLASDLPSITEVLRPAESFSFRAGEAASLAAALRELLAHPAEAGRRARAATARTVEFSWAARAGRWWQFAEAAWPPRPALAEQA